jgi:hypothetical protein
MKAMEMNGMKTDREKGNAGNGRLAGAGGLLLLAILALAGCVPATPSPDAGGKGTENRQAREMRASLSLTPDQWRIARKYAGVASEFYGYEYIPARVERYSDAEGVITVDLAFDFPGDEFRRVRVTSRPAADGSTRTARVEPLPEENRDP